MKSYAIALMVALSALPVRGQQHVSIEVPARGGGTPGAIQADVYGSGERGVILAHGGRFNKESWRKQAEVLARNGFLVLAFNYRGDTVNPDGTPSAEGSDEDNAADVLAAAAYLRGRGVRTVFAIGGSMGGDAVGEADANSPDGTFDRVVFLGSAGGNEPQKLKGRKLFIVARDDESESGKRLPVISQHFDLAPQPKRLIVVNGSAHAQFLFDSDQGPLVMDEILDFVLAK